MAPQLLAVPPRRRPTKHPCLRADALEFLTLKGDLLNDYVGYICVFRRPAARCSASHAATTKLLSGPPAGGEPRAPALVERKAASHQGWQVEVVPRGHEDHRHALDDAELLPDPDERWLILYASRAPVQDLLPELGLVVLMHHVPLVHRLGATARELCARFSGSEEAVDLLARDRRLAVVAPEELHRAPPPSHDTSKIGSNRMAEHLAGRGWSSSTGSTGAPATSLTSKELRMGSRPFVWTCLPSTLDHFSIF